MTAALEGLSHREVALLAAALLVPIPALAASGLNVPLPGVVERGLASLAPGGTDRPGPRETTSTVDVPAQADGSAAAGPTKGVEDASARTREATGGAEGLPTRTEGGSSSGVDAPGVDDSPAGGGTSSGGNPDPGAVPANLEAPPTLPDIAPRAPDTAAAEELPAQVSVNEDGVGVDVGDNSTGTGAGVGVSAPTSGDTGASAGVTTDDGTQVGVDTPPLPVPGLPGP